MHRNTHKAHNETFITLEISRIQGYHAQTRNTHLLDTLGLGEWTNLRGSDLGGVQSMDRTV